MVTLKASEKINDPGAALTTPGLADYPKEVTDVSESSTRSCEIEDCTRPLLARGMCGTHYARWKRARPETPTCVMDGCTRPVISREMCTRHYNDWRRTVGFPGQPDCKEDGCENPAFAYGWCEMHHGRWRRHGTTDRVIGINEGNCSEDGCDKPAKCKGMCVTHYNFANRREYKARNPLCIEPGCDQPQRPSIMESRCDEHAAPWRRRGLLLKRGFTPESFDNELALQGNRCKICPTTDPGLQWHIDHDHNLGCCDKEHTCERCFRGIVCSPCNTALGMMRDDPSLLRAAADYLEAAALRQAEFCTNS